jgi:hypothetical protein
MTPPQKYAHHTHNLTEFTLCYVKSRYASHLVGVLDIERISMNLKDKLGDTVRVLRPPPRVFTDHCGQSVWMGKIEPLELELEHPVITDPYNSAKVRKLW